MAKEKTKNKTETAKNTAAAPSERVGSRGRILQGFVIRKFPKRITIEFERTVYLQKFERFLKRKTRVHARIPNNADVNIGDLVRVQECRPLSKITKFMFVEKVSSNSDGKNEISKENK